MIKTDLRKSHRPLFRAPVGEYVLVDVPRLMFLKVDGRGDPNTTPAYPLALQWLYGTAYAAKFAAKAMLQQDFAIGSLEGLWWADDPASFVTRSKAHWNWTMMMVPDFVAGNVLDAALAKTGKKLGARPASCRLEPLDEGMALQTLHIGSYDDEGPILAKLHREVMPERGYTFAGAHHEIYLSDPRRTAPHKLKTILRQPVKLVKMDSGARPTSP